MVIILLFLLYSLIFFSIIKTLKNNIFSICMASLVAQLVKNPPAMQETPVRFLGPEDRWRRNRLPTPVFLGLPGGLAGKESACSVGDLDRFLGWEDPIEKERLPTPVFWPGEFHGLYTPCRHKESDTDERLLLSRECSLNDSICFDNEKCFY